MAEPGSTCLQHWLALETQIYPLQQKFIRNDRTVWKEESCWSDTRCCCPRFGRGPVCAPQAVENFEPLDAPRLTAELSSAHLPTMRGSSSLIFLPSFLPVPPRYLPDPHSTRRCLRSLLLDAEQHSPSALWRPHHPSLSLPQARPDPVTSGPWGSSKVSSWMS